MTLLIGIPACTRVIRGHPQHAAPARYGAALMGGADALPVLIPPVGEAALAVLDRLDGLLLSGSPSNVEPARYGATEDETPGLHDPARDATTLPLIREALRRDMPLLAICRGIQELNVALGGSLHQRVHCVPGHRPPGGRAGGGGGGARWNHRCRAGSGQRLRLRGAVASGMGICFGHGQRHPVPRLWRRLPRLCRRDQKGGMSVEGG